MGADKKILWIFRSNLRQFEYYHKFNDNFYDFKKYCHDYYLQMGISLLEQNLIDEVYIWRLLPKNEKAEITKEFSVNGKRFVQKFVHNFSRCFDFEQPTISFFRGGFPEYDQVLLQRKLFFGKTIYLGAGKRVYPQKKNLYDLVLVEKDSELYHNQHKCKMFYKTAKPDLFFPYKTNKRIDYDLLWICNFSQITQKGQEFFINLVSKISYLQNIRIGHIGNLPERGKKLAQKYEVKNIDFLGYKDRKDINRFCNESKCAIITSNTEDGSPRLITEIMMSGTPLLVRNTTRCPRLYIDMPGVFEYSEKNLEEQIKYALENHEDIRNQIKINNNREKLSINKISAMNYYTWQAQ